MLVLFFKLSKQDNNLFAQVNILSAHDNILFGQLIFSVQDNILDEILFEQDILLGQLIILSAQLFILSAKLIIWYAQLNQSLYLTDSYLLQYPVRVSD